MPINYTALAAEINTDPLGYGYAAQVAAGSDVGVADLLNQVRAGGDGFPTITVRRADITPSEVLEAIDTRDLKASPTVLEGSWLESITQQRTMRLLNDDGSNTRVLANLRRLVNDTNGSQTRVNAIANRNGSRAEQLFGTGTYVDPQDVARALRPQA